MSEIREMKSSKVEYKLLQLERRNQAHKQRVEKNQPGIMKQETTCGTGGTHSEHKSGQW